MEATWLQLSKQKDDIATSDGVESDTDSITLEESKKLFPYQDELDERKRGLVLK